MVEGKRVAVVIPAYNEQDSIARTIASMPSGVDRVFVVNDGSTDATAQEVAAFPAEKVERADHPARQGVGCAVATGFGRAIGWGADVVVTMDADGQMDPADLGRVIGPVVCGRADCVKGNRFADPEVRRRMPRARFAVNRFLSRLERAVLGTDAVADAQCGFTAWDARFLAEMDLEGLRAGFGVYNDLVFRALRHGARIVSVPVRAIYGGRPSHIRFFDVVPGLFLMLAHHWFLRRFGARPGRGILILTSSFPRRADDPSGLFLRQFADAAFRKGVSVRVVCPDSPDADPVFDASLEYPVARFRYFWPRRLQRLAYGSGMPENLGRSVLARIQIPFFFASQAVACWRAARQTAVIHAHWAIPSGITAAWVKKWTGKKLVITVHSSDLWVLRRSAFGRMMLRWLLKQADEVLAVSRLARRTLEETAGAGSRAKIRFSPLGVAAPVLSNARLADRSRPGGVLYIGRLVEIKGVRFLIEALAGEADAGLIVAGEGCEKRRLEELAAERGLNARFCGNVAGAEKTLLFERSGVVVFPSVPLGDGRREGVPVALLEALSHGCAVIASDAGAIGEVIRDGENGVLVPPGDARALRRAIRRVLSDGEFRRRISENGRRTAADFTLPGALKRHLDVYQALGAA